MMTNYYLPIFMNAVFTLKYAFNKVFGNEIIFAVISRLKRQKTYFEVRVLVTCDTMTMNGAQNFTGKPAEVIT